jgi:hypothetical protein
MQRDVSPSTVTSGVRIMVPTLTASAWFIGLVLIGQPASRTSGPAFEAAKQMFAIQIWGILFLICGAIKLTGMLINDRRVLVAGLALGGTMFGVWGGFIIAAAFRSPLVSYSSFVYVIIPVIAHTAVLFSLVRDKVWR